MLTQDERSRGRRSRIVVLLTLRAHEAFARLLAAGAPADVEFRYFSWRNALLGPFDVCHLHWPEHLIRNRGAWPLWVLKAALLVMFLVRVRMTRRPIVQTIHNLHPHEQLAGMESRLFNLCNRTTSLFIRLCPLTPVPRFKHAVTIPHAHYRAIFQSYRLPSPVDGRFLFFGLIREYKGVETLLKAFRNLESPNATLRIVGRPFRGCSNPILEACCHDPRITCRLEFVADGVLAEEIGRAQLVVLPYRRMHNSGALLLALSLGRPVLAPFTPANEEITREVGEGWLFMYHGNLGPDELDAALHAARKSLASRGPPELPRRDPSRIGEEHLRAYQKALEITCRQQGESTSHAGSV